MISLDTRLKGEALLLRRSMIKFTGSRPLPMYLNRQYIKIMEDLGIDPDVLMELQNDAVVALHSLRLTPRAFWSANSSANRPECLGSFGSSTTYDLNSWKTPSFEEQSNWPCCHAFVSLSTVHAS